MKNLNKCFPKILMILALVACGHTGDKKKEKGPVVDPNAELDAELKTDWWKDQAQGAKIIASLRDLGRNDDAMLAESKVETEILRSISEAKLKKQVEDNPCINAKPEHAELINNIFDNTESIFNSCLRTSQSAFDNSKCFDAYNERIPPFLNFFSVINGCK